MAGIPSSLAHLVDKHVIVFVSLWGVTGMVRGSWIALDGRKPAFAEFTRWDGAAASRGRNRLVGHDGVG